MESVPVTFVTIGELKQTSFDTVKYFESSYGTYPSFFARVPGRVNLIGEHIDYSGYSVLPMAIEQDIIIAARTNKKGVLNLRNYDNSYQNFTAPIDNLIIDKSSPQWYHYFLCGYKGISESFDLKNIGMDVVVKGTVPPSSGLSSSSALVCASALATCYANRVADAKKTMREVAADDAPAPPSERRPSSPAVSIIEHTCGKMPLAPVIPTWSSDEDEDEAQAQVSLNKNEMASFCAVSERLIGTEGGGMDQAIGFLAEPGTAKVIDFNPLKATSVPLPDDAVFVVSNSCVAMNKAASSQFNIRVMECRLAAKVLAKEHGLDWKSVAKLAEIPVMLNKDLSEMHFVVSKTLKPDIYTREELCSLFEISDNEFSEMLSENTKMLESFQLFKRATHVYEEAHRVQKFKMVCEKNENALQDLGQLMNESHSSCRDLYECSHPQLDELVKAALDAGAIGSRLTGAGWGGCCVSLVEKTKVDEFLQTLSKTFYSKIEMKVDLSVALFSTKPSGGAAVYVLII